MPNTKRKAQKKRQRLQKLQDQQTLQNPQQPEKKTAKLYLSSEGEATAKVVTYETEEELENLTKQFQSEIMNDEKRVKEIEDRMKARLMYMSMMIQKGINDGSISP